MYYMPKYASLVSSRLTLKYNLDDLHLQNIFFSRVKLSHQKPTTSQVFASSKPTESQDIYFTTLKWTAVQHRRVKSHMWHRGEPNGDLWCKQRSPRVSVREIHLAEFD